MKTLEWRNRSIETSLWVDDTIVLHNKTIIPPETKSGCLNYNDNQRFFTIVQVQSLCYEHKLENSRED